MKIWSDPVRFRRTVAGLAAIAAGLFTFAGMLADPPATGDGVEPYLTSLVENPNLVQLSAPLLWVGFTCTVVMLLTWVRLVRRRGVVLAHVGALLAIPAMMTMTGMLIIDLVDLSLAQEVGVQRAAEISSATEVMPGLVPFILQAPLGILGFLLLVVALWRSGFVPGSFAGVVIAAQLAFFLGAPIRPVGQVAAGVLALAYGWFGMVILQLDDASWIAGVRRTEEIDEPLAVRVQPA